MKCNRPKCIRTTGAFVVSRRRHDAAAALSATLLNVLLAAVPRAVMAVMQTTTIRASITAYSTAVGPSSARKKFVNQRVIRFGPRAWAAISL
jgi:hypothetical protein